MSPATGIEKTKREELERRLTQRIIEDTDLTEEDLENLSISEIEERLGIEEKPPRRSPWQRLGWQTSSYSYVPKSERERRREKVRQKLED